MKHELKIWPCYYEAVKHGKKTFEYRYNKDRGFQAGDRVCLKEYNPEKKEYVDSCWIFASIGYVLPVDSDHCVFSLLDVTQEGVWP